MTTSSSAKLCQRLRKRDNFAILNKVLTRFVTSFLIFVGGQVSLAASMHCAELDAIAQEAVAYHLTGAGTTDLPLDCAKKTKWRYFNPTIEAKSGEPYNNPEYIWFEPGRDKFVVDKITPFEKGHHIHATFTIKGQKITTTYLYLPHDQMQKYVGVCGTVTKPGKPWIFRADCKAPEKSKKPAKK